MMILRIRQLCVYSIQYNLFRPFCSCRILKVSASVILPTVCVCVCMYVCVCVSVHNQYTVHV